MIQEINPSYKVIADHLRSSAFLIADGVLPSNEGRGYVLRRIMRRSMRHVHKLHSKEPVMYKLVPSLIKEMGAAYPELERAQFLITDTLKIEEEKFRTTLGHGMEILEAELKKIKTGEKFSGAVAFKLYDTYGFPLDLTEDILREKNIVVDLDGFNLEMAAQKKRGKENWSGSGETKEDDTFLKLKEKFGETKFVGYENTKFKTKILDIVKGVIILEQTPFYATSGGQKGDDGYIILANDVKNEDLIDVKKLNNFCHISETKKATGLHIHLIDSEKSPGNLAGNLKVGDEVIAIVNNRNRQFRAQNHSATHLLHLALKQVLGQHVTQKGSNVDSKYLTFDFNHHQLLSEKEVEQVEDLVNFYIRQASPIVTEILPIEQARNKGAMALFGEKYDNVVRVLEMGQSIELCGGTHAKSTGNIGIFKIISEKGIASGIRRIEAMTGYFALQHLRLQERKLEALLTGFKFKYPSDEIASNEFYNAKTGFDSLSYFSAETAEQNITSQFEVEEMRRIVEETANLAASRMLEIKNLQKEIEQLKKEKLSANNNLKAEKIGAINFVYHLFEGVNAKELRDLTTETKSKKEYQQSSIILFFGVEKNDGVEKLSAVLGVSPDLTTKFSAQNLIPQIAEKIGGKGGGGKPDLAMCGGANKSGIDQAISAIKQLLSHE